MAIMMSGSIDLSKIDKSKIIEGKQGGKYYNILIILNDEKDKYGNDVSITAAQSKEERERKDKKTYLGNGRMIWEGGQKKEAAQVEESKPVNEDDLPF